MAFNRRRVNAILLEMVGLAENGSMKKVKLRVTNEFVSRFKSNRMIHVESLKTQFQQLDPDKVNLLEVPFTEEEICGALMGTDGNKAPDPGGCTFKFAQMFWPDLKDELIALFNRFFVTAKFDHRFQHHLYI